MHSNKRSRADERRLRCENRDLRRQLAQAAAAAAAVAAAPQQDARLSVNKFRAALSGDDEVFPPQCLSWSSWDAAAWGAGSCVICHSTYPHNLALGREWQTIYGTTDHFCGLCAAQVYAIKGAPVSAYHWARQNLTGPVMILERIRRLNIMCRKIAMNDEQFASFLEALDPATSPAALAQELGHAPGGPVLTARQGAAVLRKLGHIVGRLQASLSVDSKVYHVVGTRVIDRWALNGDDHDIAACYCARSPREIPAGAIFDEVALLDWLIQQSQRDCSPGTTTRQLQARRAALP